jgi:hypothetical protein
MEPDEKIGEGLISWFWQAGKGLSLCPPNR